MSRAVAVVRRHPKSGIASITPLVPPQCLTDGMLLYAEPRADVALACIDIVARHGGSVEIEAAIRLLIADEAAEIDAADERFPLE